MSLFHERLCQLKEESGQKNKEIAEALDLSPSRLSHYLNTQGAEPPYAVLNRMADYFRVTTDYLTGRSCYRSYEEKQRAERLTVGNTDLYQGLTERERDTVKSLILFLYDGLCRVYRTAAAPYAKLRIQKTIENLADAFVKIVNFQTVTLTPHTKNGDSPIPWDVEEQFSVVSDFCTVVVADCLRKIIQNDHFTREKRELIVRGILNALDNPDEWKADREDEKIG